MRRERLHLFVLALTIILSTSAASADILNLTVSGGQINNTGTVTVSGYRNNTTGGDTIAFNLSDGSTFELRNKTDTYTLDGNFSIEIDLGSNNDGYWPEFSDDLINVSADQNNTTGFQEAEAFDNFTLDDTRPTINSVKTVDTDNNGDMDGVNVTFSENVNNMDTGDVNDSNRAYSVNSVSTTGNTTFYEFSSYDNDTATTPKVNFTAREIQDDADNSLSQVVKTATDGASPVLLNAVINSRESSTSSTVVKLNFSESVSDASDDSKGVNISGKQIQFDSISSNNVHDVNYSEALNTGKKPNITGFDNVEDGSSNSAVLYKGNKVDVDTFRRHLSTGWNYVSFPIASTSTPDVSNFFSSSQVEEVWKYIEGEWTVYNPDKPDNSNFSDIKGGEGYLVDVKKGFTLAPNVENVPNPSSGLETPVSMKMTEGWNLVGHYQEFKQPANSTGAFESIGSSFGSIRTQKSSGSLSVDTGVSELKPGSAYWVSTSGDLSGGSVTYSER